MSNAALPGLSASTSFAFTLTLAVIASILAVSEGIAPASVENKNKAREVVSGAGSSAADLEWPRFRGPQGDGAWNSKSIPKDLAELSPKKLWSQEIGAGFGGVTVAGGRVYLMDRIKAPEEVERILCHDAATGELIWNHSYAVKYDNLEYGSGPRASVTLHRGVAYALGALGMLHALDAASGDVLWQIDTRAEFDAEPPRWGLAASPFIWKDTVILHLGAKPGGSLICLELATGKEKWRYGNDPAGYATPMLIQHENKEQLIQWGPEHVASVNPDTGEEHWKFAYPIQYGVSIAQPLFKNHLLLVSSYWHGTRAIRLGTDIKNAALEWSQEKVLRCLMSQPLYKDGVVYLLDRTEGVIAFRLDNGEILWKDGHQFTPRDRNPQISLVWADEPRNIACGLNASGELFFAQFTSDEYLELSRHQIIGKTWAHPAFTHNTVFARSDSELAAWQLWE